MEITESFVRGKQSGELCEDGIVVTPDFAAVVDGSTSKTPFQLSPGMKNGRLAMTLICDFIRSMPAQTTCLEFCQGVTRRISEEYERAGLAERMKSHPEERLCASAVVYSEARGEVWMAGDCQAIIDGTPHYNPKPGEERIARRRARLILGGMPALEARRAIEPELIRGMTEGQNRRYAVLDGTPVYMPGVKVLPVRSCAVLASDGYPALLPTLAESEAALARQIERDPQNIRFFFATKGIVEGNCSFDDRAFVKVKMEL